MTINCTTTTGGGL